MISPYPPPTWRAPAGNAFRRILKVTERSFLHLYADALSSSNSVSCHIWGQGRGLGQLSPAHDIESRLKDFIKIYMI